MPSEPQTRPGWEKVEPGYYTWSEESNGTREVVFVVRSHRDYWDADRKYWKVEVVRYEDRASCGGGEEVFQRLALAQQHAEMTWLPRIREARRAWVDVVNERVERESGNGLLRQLRDVVGADELARWAKMADEHRVIRRDRWSSAAVGDEIAAGLLTFTVLYRCGMRDSQCSHHRAPSRTASPPPSVDVAREWAQENAQRLAAAFASGMRWYAGHMFHSYTPMQHGPQFFGCMASSEQIEVSSREAATVRAAWAQQLARAREERERERERERTSERRLTVAGAVKAKVLPR